MVHLWNCENKWLIHEHSTWGMEKLLKEKEKERGKNEAVIFVNWHLNRGHWNKLKKINLSLTLHGKNLKFSPNCLLIWRQFSLSMLKACMAGNKRGNVLRFLFLLLFLNFYSYLLFFILKTWTKSLLMQKKMQPLKLRGTNRQILCHLLKFQGFSRGVITTTWQLKALTVQPVQSL